MTILSASSATSPNKSITRAIDWAKVHTGGRANSFKVAREILHMPALI